jgi:N-acetylglutamate synthase-like GNAT family acetyltransferase
VVREVFRRRHISAPLVEHAYAQAREQDIQDVELMVAELKAATADDAQRVAHTDSRVCQKKWWGL